MKINGTDAEEFIAGLRERWHVPGVAIDVRVGDEKMFFCSGLSCVEKGKWIDEDTIVPVGSVTKSFVARAARLLVKEGLLEWDVPVTRYVKDLKFADTVVQQEATLADFLSMRTGLGTPNSPAGASPCGEPGGAGIREEWRGDEDFGRIKALAAAVPVEKEFRQSS